MQGRAFVPRLLFSQEHVLTAIGALLLEKAGDGTASVVCWNIL
ncbi:hypothetical protein SAMN05518866_102249 [Sphingobium sp. YR768]|nr:hypothetical protein SAMN05518866_102249 [Sphingobium sp. YR768]